MLSDAEEAVLNAPADAEVELEPLLAALRRSQEVHGRASARLLGTQFQPLGLEVMERMAAHERAYASLYRWVHAQCSQLQPDDAASVARLRVGVESLRGRPQLLSYALHEVVACARVVHRAFLQRLAAAGTAARRGAGDAPAEWLASVLSGVQRRVTTEAALLRQLFAAALSLARAELADALRVARGVARGAPRARRAVQSSAA